ncbi:MAG: hypothetical protein LBK41_02935 [Clostridiales bacterium]|nr:hypothetical protein [Clostridiales bacterium]
MKFRLNYLSLTVNSTNRFICSLTANAPQKTYYVYMTATANKFPRIYYARVKAYLDGVIG